MIAECRREQGDRPVELHAAGEQTLLVERVASQEVVLEHTAGPDAELGSAPGLDPAADRQDGVQVLVGDDARDLATALVLNCCILSTVAAVAARSSSPLSKIDLRRPLAVVVAGRIVAAVRAHLVIPRLLADRQVCGVHGLVVFEQQVRRHALRPLRHTVTTRPS